MTDEYDVADHKWVNRDYTDKQDCFCVICKKKVGLRDYANTVCRSCAMDQEALKNLSIDKTYILNLVGCQECKGYGKQIDYRWREYHAYLQNAVMVEALSPTDWFNLNVSKPTRSHGHHTFIHDWTEHELPDLFHKCYDCYGEGKVIKLEEQEDGK